MVGEGNSVECRKDCRVLLFLTAALVAGQLACALSSRFNTEDYFRTSNTP